MDFESSEEQGMALDGWKRAVELDISPMAKRFHDRDFTRDAALTLTQAIVPYGVGSGRILENGGGMGLDFLISGLLLEELAKASADAAGLAWVPEGSALQVYANGSDEIKARYLPRLAAGEATGSLDAFA